MESAIPVVCETLRLATSQDPTVLKPAEAKLKEWETERGFYAVLLVSMFIFCIIFLSKFIDKHYDFSLIGFVKKQLW